jgi:hypothetical protein
MSAKQEAFRIFMSMRTEICLLHDSELLKDKIAKQCASIAVDEILKTHKKISVSHKISAYKTAKDFMQSGSDIQNQIDNHVLNNFGYWAEVKQQIELL